MHFILIQKRLHFSVPGPYKPKTPKAVKSPKPEKASKSGKQGTKWDPFMFNGKGPSEREAKELERTVKSGTDTQLDPQLSQYVPDISRVNQSAGIYYLWF